MSFIWHFLAVQIVTSVNLINYHISCVYIVIGLFYDYLFLLSIQHHFLQYWKKKEKKMFIKFRSYSLYKNDQHSFVVCPPFFLAALLSSLVVFVLLLQFKHWPFSSSIFIYFEMCSFFLMFIRFSLSVFRKRKQKQLVYIYFIADFSW